jgi:hypothetical protein
MIEWMKGLTRDVLLFVFYCSPLGWAYLLGLAYLEITDWLTLSFEKKVEKYKQVNKGKENSQDLTGPAVGLFRIFSHKDSL